MKTTKQNGFIQNAFQRLRCRSWQRVLSNLGYSIFALSLNSGIAHSQTVTSEINGTITDPTNAVLPGASVIAEDVNRGTSFSTTSDSRGSYDLRTLPVGTYTVTVSDTGFQTEVLPPVTLVLNQVAEINFKMKVGANTQVVNVSSDAPLLQTETTELGTIVDANTNVSLPLASRNYLQLALLAPGAVTPNPSLLYNAQTVLSSGQPYINGNRSQDNNFLLDGMENTELSDNLVAFSPAPDAIEEFNLITQNAPAQFGDFEGGIVSVSIKSGTNKFNGDAWEFFRNNVLNANSWSNNLLNSEDGSDVAPTPGLRWNMFGGTLGGPIIKNKLFFFVDYQGQRFDTIGSATPYNAFTAQERAGNFGQICTDPGHGKGSFNGAGICSNAAGQVNDPFTGTPIPNNNISAYIAANADPQLTTYYNSGGGKVNQNVINSPYYPSVSSLLPGSGSVGNPGLLNNFVYSEKTPLNVDQGDFKSDWSISEKNHLFGRYSREQLTSIPVTTFALVAVENETNLIWNGVLDWSHVFNSKVVNDLRGGVDWVQLDEISATSTPANFGATVGISGAAALPLVNGGPSSGWGANGQGLKYDDTLLEAEDNLSVNFGRHSTNIGFQFLRDRVDTFFAGGGGLLGNYTFAGNFTNSPDADLYLGLTNTEEQYFTNKSPGVEPQWGQRSSVFGAYFQDDWKIRSNLTLNLGLRLQINSPFVEVHGDEVNYDPISGQPLYPAGRSLPTTVTFPGLQPHADKNQALYNGYYGIGDWEPRIGFAYTPSITGGRLVVRGAYTVSDYLEGTGNNLRPTQNIPFNLNINLVNTCSGGTSGCNPLQLELNNGIVPSITAPFSGVSLNDWAPNVRPAIDQQWNLTAQQIIGKDTTIQVGYVGQRGTHLMVPEELLQAQLQSNGTVTPSPYFAGNPDLLAQISHVKGTFSVGTQSYNALQAVLQKHLSAGLEAQVSYSYSHCLTNSIGFYTASGQTSAASAYWQNLYNPRAEWGSCFFDLTHDLTANAVYELPIGNNKPLLNHLNPAVNEVVGHWTVSPIYTWHGGFPLTILSGSDYSGTNSGGARANCNAQPRYLKQATAVGIQWFDPTVYSNQSRGAFGTCGVSTVRGPGLDQIDMSLQKNFPMRDSLYLQFRSEFINALNHPIFDAPASTCSGSASVLGTPSPCSVGLGMISASQGQRTIQFALKLYY